MKYLISCLLLLTTILCACTTAITGETVTTEAQVAETKSEGTESVSSVQYRTVREYEITKLDDFHRYDSKTYVSGDHIYVFEPVLNDSKTRYIPYLTVFDLTGNKEIIYPPEAKELLSEKEDGTVRCEQMPYYAYALSDQRWFVIYDRFMLILDADGNTQTKGFCSANLQTISHIRIDETENGLQIVISDTTCLYYYDETLTLIHTFSDTGSSIGAQSIGYLGDGIYRSGIFLYQIMLSNIKDGSITYENLKIPSENRFDQFFTAQDGTLYFFNDDGIFRYEADRQPACILRWEECGFYISGTDMYWMVDDSHILISRTEDTHGVTSNTLYLIAITKTQVPVTNTNTITLLAYQSSEWLSNAVYQFNRTNGSYTVNLVNDTTFAKEERIAEIEQLLLTGGADMILPYEVSDLTVYFDKNAFVDLKPYFAERVFGCIETLYSEDAMYILPMSFAFTTLIAPEHVLNGKPLTWENFYAVRDTLPEDAMFAVAECQNSMTFGEDQNGNRIPRISYADLPMRMYTQSLSDFADASEKVSGYDTDAFRDMILCLQWMAEHMDETAGGIDTLNIPGHPGMVISNGSLVNRLRDGGTAFAETEIVSLECLSLLQRLFGDTAYEICGYPSMEGGYIAVNRVSSPIAVLESTAYKDGCIEFLEFLLSKEMQTAETVPYFPVTSEALSTQIDNKRYFYYQKNVVGKLESPSGGMIEISNVYTEPNYIEDFGFADKTEDIYAVYDITEDDKAAILSFFDTIPTRTKADEKILSIVNEELSYWQNNARTLEETTNIIDSRVWIYLNE